MEIIKFYNTRWNLVVKKDKRPNVITGEKANGICRFPRTGRGEKHDPPLDCQRSRRFRRQEEVEEEARRRRNGKLACRGMKWEAVGGDEGPQILLARIPYREEGRWQGDGVEGKLRDKEDGAAPLIFFCSRPLSLGSSLCLCGFAGGSPEQR